MTKTKSNAKGGLKGRLQSTYDRKVYRMTKWYNRLLKEKSKPVQLNPNTDLNPKRKELKALADYVALIRRPTTKST